MHSQQEHYPGVQLQVLLAKPLSFSHQGKSEFERGLHQGDASWKKRTGSEYGFRLHF